VTGPKPVEYLTVTDAAAELAVSEWVVLNLIRKQGLPARRLANRHLQIERGMFERWIQDKYAETRQWQLENPNDGFHGDWRDWPIGRRDDDDQRPTTG
jgi:hypothetical protein